VLGGDGVEADSGEGGGDNSSEQFVQFESPERLGLEFRGWNAATGSLKRANSTAR